MVRVPTVSPESLDRATFNKKFRTEMPVVIQGMCRTWGAHERWEPSQLKQMVGDMEVQPFVAFDNVHFLESEDIVQRRAMPLSQVIEHVFEGRPVILENNATTATPITKVTHSNGMTFSTNSPRLQSTVKAAPAAEVVANRIYLRGALFDALRGDIEVPSFMEGGNANLSDTLSGIWVGSGGCITPLHFDAWHGVLCQVRGRKRVTMFSPDDTENMYPHKQEDGKMNMHTSKLVLEKLSDPAYIAEYPRAKELTPWVCDLGPGDALYIPPFWWHHVESLDPSISVPLRWEIGEPTVQWIALSSSAAV